MPGSARIRTGRKRLAGDIVTGGDGWRMVEEEVGDEGEEGW